jgi:GDP-4-dehydro-6-deoxy-D-mannose reductase
MRILVTGSDGFVGKYLISELQRSGHEVFAGVRIIKENTDNTFPATVFDILNQENILDVLAQIRPHGIIHLAAQSKVKQAWAEPADTFNTNVIGTINLISAAKNVSPDVKILSVGSGEEYGKTANDVQQLTEEDPCDPQNPYAVSKYAAGKTALQLGSFYTLRVIHARAFNHFGPGQKKGFVISDFASQVAAIEKNILPPVLKVGDLTASRDFTDVRDVVKAYRLLIDNDISEGVYNICSGKSYSIEWILNKIISFSKSNISVKKEQDKLRPSEIPVFVGSASKIMQTTGWKIEMDFEDSLLDSLNWWREKISVT